MTLLRRPVRRTGPLRVLYVVPDLRVGGAERHATTLLPALDRTRFTPSALCIGQEGALFGMLGQAGVPARALGRSKRRFLLALADLVREMRRSRPDVVITRGYNAEMLGRIAAVLSRVPRTIVWVHHCGELTPRSRLRRLADRLLGLATTAYYGVAHGQVPYLTGDLGYPAAKIRVIPNGTDPAALGDDPTARRDPAVAATLGIGPDDPVVGILAALRPEKDHASLLRAARLVMDDIPGTRLLIVGDGPLRPELQRLAGELGIGDRVLFAGNRSDVGDLLRIMDVVTLSSTTIECAPMALLEAMAAARPAVCTAVGGVPDIVAEGVTGYLVPPRDPQALADRLVALLRDPERARLMGKAARQRLEAEFTLEGSIREAQRALEETAGRTSPGRTSPGRTSPGPVHLTVVLDRISLGGAETLLLNLLGRLDPALVSPRVVCLREGGPLAADFRAAGIPVDVLGRTGRFDPRTVPRLMRHFRRHRTHAVLVTHHQRAPLTLGRIAARLAGVPANIVAAHDMDLTAVGKRCLPRHDVATLFLSSALVLLTPSQGHYLHREEGVGRYPWRRLPEVVIPNGIPLPPVSTPDDRARARTNLGVGPDDFVVGIVARLAPQKAHHVLFEAVARLAPAHPRLRLVVVGDGDRAAELASLAHRLGLADRVHFTGARRDIALLLTGFDVSCLSSVHEGVPITVIESMAAGVPVVATDCGALPDMVTDGEDGFLVPVGDAAALADRIATLAADPALRARMGARGRCRAERDHRIEATAAGFEHLLTSLVPRR